MRAAILFVVSVTFVLAVCLNPSHAQTPSEQEVDAIKQDVSRLYLDTSKKVSVRLRSGARLMGYINAVGGDTFTLRTRPNTDTEVRYADVLRVSRTGLSKGQKWALAGAAVGAVVVAGIVFRPKGKGGLRCLLCN